MLRLRAGRSLSVGGRPGPARRRLARDAEAVIDAHGLRRPIVIGFSDGGITAIRMAIALRREFGALIMIGTDADLPPESVTEGIFAKLTPQGWREKFPDGVALYGRLNPMPDFDRLFAKVVGMWRDPSPENYPGSRVCEVACPTLVLGGDADHIVPRAVTHGLAERIAGSHLGIIPFCGHGIFQQHPEQVAGHIRRFIETLE